jgi:hypothetical protein
VPGGAAKLAGGAGTGLAGLSFFMCDGTVITSEWVRPSRFFVRHRWQRAAGDQDDRGFGEVADRGRADHDVL